MVFVLMVVMSVYVDCVVVMFDYDGWRW